MPAAVVLGSVGGLLIAGSPDPPAPIEVPVALAPRSPSAVRPAPPPPAPREPWPSTRTALGVDLPRGYCVLYFRTYSRLQRAHSSTWWCRIRGSAAETDERLEFALDVVRSRTCNDIAVRVGRHPLESGGFEDSVCTLLSLSWDHMDHDLLRVTTLAARGRGYYLLRAAGFEVLWPREP